MASKYLSSLEAGSSVFNRLSLIMFGVLLFMVTTSNALQCYQCGQYNDGVGSITPCPNYTETAANLFLKDCPKSTDKYCIVSTFYYTIHTK